jgi:hypothetical protein
MGIVDLAGGVPRRCQRSGATWWRSVRRSRPKGDVKIRCRKRPGVGARVASPRCPLRTGSFVSCTTARALPGNGDATSHSTVNWSSEPPMKSREWSHRRDRSPSWAADLAPTGSHSHGHLLITAPVRNRASPTSQNLYWRLRTACYVHVPGVVRFSTTSSLPRLVEDQGLTVVECNGEPSGASVLARA